MPHPKLISKEVTAIPTVGDISEIQILTNLSRVHDFQVNIVLANESKQELKQEAGE